MVGNLIDSTIIGDKRIDQKNGKDLEAQRYESK